MFNKVYEKIKKNIKENYKFLVVVLLFFFLFFYELPFVIYRPGGTIDLNNRIFVEEAYKGEGKLSMAYVSMMRGKIPLVLLSFFMPNWDLESSKNITMENESVDDTLARDHLLLEVGLDNATISAYRLANKEIQVKHIYPIITYITKEAQTNLEVGDIILKVNDQEFSTLNDLQTFINSLNEEEQVHFKVLRNKKEKECDAKIYKVDHSFKVGISIVEKYEYSTNPKITIETKKSESGSSGGLMTALAIYNALTEEDITKNRKIVGTGTIDVLGNVGEIGGIKYKLLGAEKDHADIFLCPLENYEEAKLVKEKNKLQIKLIPVKSLQEAILELKK